MKVNELVVNERNKNVNERNEKYTTLQLIEDLRNCLNGLVPSELYRGKLAYWKASKYLGLTYTERKKKNGYYNYYSVLERIRRIMTKSDDPRYNPNYLFSKEILDTIKRRLREYFGGRAINCINLIERYEHAHPNLKENSYQQWHIHNPDLIAHYFDIIDSIEKAYWLGFLAADGYICYGKYKPTPSDIRSGKTIRYRYTIEITIHYDDNELLTEFCKTIKLNPDKISLIREEGKARLVFDCKPMAKALEKYGLKSPKASFLKLLSFSSRELLLAFLRGFYDGDGHSKSTRIACISKVFLEQIQKELNIRNPVRLTRERYEYFDEEGKLHVRENVWVLYLGARVFNEMTQVSKDIFRLTRKDHVFSERLEAYNNLKESLNKLGIDKEKLQKLVLESRQYELIEMFSTTEKLFRKLREEWNIKLPPKGYWSQV